MGNHLIEFSFSNYRSFKNINSLSLLASKMKAKNENVDFNNQINIDNNYSILTSAAIYGANASGKSNLLRAISIMRFLVINSTEEEVALDLLSNIIPHRLNSVTEKSPSFFQIVILIDGKRYRYGFETKENKVITEWLFTVPNVRETPLFIREENKFQISRNFKEGKGLEERTRENALFLSVVNQWNGPISKQITNWFRNFRVISGLNDLGYKNFSEKNFANGTFRDEMIRLIKKLDLGILDIKSTYEYLEKDSSQSTMEISEITQSKKNKQTENEKIGIQTIHQKFDAQDQPVELVEFDLQKDESEGTKKLFYLSGPIIDVISNGMILVVDEIEARLHPLITLAIIQLFNSKETNPLGAQLIFSTHDTNMLSNDYFRRDQIWFVEKDQKGTSHLYSLADLRERNDLSLESNYINGRFGAIPFLKNDMKIVCDEP